MESIKRRSRNLTRRRSKTNIRHSMKNSKPNTARYKERSTVSKDTTRSIGFFRSSNTMRKRGMTFFDPLPKICPPISIFVTTAVSGVIARHHYIPENYRLTCLLVPKMSKTIRLLAKSKIETANSLIFRKFYDSKKNWKS